MFNILAKAALLLLLSTTMVFAYQVIRFNVSYGDADERNELFNEIVEVDLEDTGFVPKDVHPGIENFYKLFYGNKVKKDGSPNPKFKHDYVANLDNIGFITIANEIKMREMFLKEPKIGAFAPLNYLIFKKKSSSSTHVGTLTPQAMLDIAKIKNEEVRKNFTEMIDELSEITDAGMGGKVEFTKIDKLPEDTMMEFEIPFRRGEYIAEVKYEIMEKLEKAFEAEDYIIAGKRDFGEFYADEELAFGRFDAYWVYSLCHFEFSYTVFNVWERPELGVSAPCSMYMYIEKGKNILHVGMPNVTNWIVIGHIKDPQKIKFIKEMDAKIRNIMISLGAKEV